MYLPIFLSELVNRLNWKLMIKGGLMMWNRFFALLIVLQNSQLYLFDPERSSASKNLLRPVRNLLEI